jgi:hypothetical protein
VAAIIQKAIGAGPEGEQKQCEEEFFREKLVKKCVASHLRCSRRAFAVDSMIN